MRAGRFAAEAIGSNLFPSCGSFGSSDTVRPMLHVGKEETKEPFELHSSVDVQVSPHNVDLLSGAKP
jgi:hypothetical protein